MQRKYFIWVLLIGIIVPRQSYAQEETNADITNEVVDDAFQENFYEALKQRGIENYDRAVSFLLECNRMDPENRAVKFELGKNYADLQQYDLAITYLQDIVKKEPGNIWYTDALLKVYEQTKQYPKAIELAEELVIKQPEYNENLAYLYTHAGKYEEALKVVLELEDRFGEDPSRKGLKELLSTKLNLDTLNPGQKGAEPEEHMSRENSILDNLKRLIGQKDYTTLLSVANSALETYPSNPEIYYAKGVALAGLNKHDDAVEFLLMGLDYIIDNDILKNNIYKQLVVAYKALGNPTKEQEYQKKIKE